jgi:hypothetical protein
MLKRPTSITFVWQALLWACLCLEGLWLVFAFGMTPSPYAYQLWLILALRLLVVISVISFREMPQVPLGAAVINLVGSMLITNRPGGDARSWLWFIYYQSIELLIVISTFAIWHIRRRARIASAR